MIVGPGAYLEMYRAGKTVSEIAEFREMKATTVNDHLIECYEQGEEIEIDSLVSPARQHNIEAVFARSSTRFLSPVKKELGDGYS